MMRYCILNESANLNFIELDLVRGGQRMPMHDPWPGSPYYLLVNRQGQAQRCQVWPAFSLRALPSLTVPLAPPDADMALPLQSLVDAIYERSRYRARIDYAGARSLLSADQAFLLRALAEKQS